ncbi:interleukin-12 subunit beta-like [Spea bombifrons]|uniref:interleukin-12 subunit beta-like n=1 Tax=Spea bombifrons TaxID=233779 RepID=UPI002349E987|nr:interleukin-12 subunit beta-like [Spea bombifrons]
MKENGTRCRPPNRVNPTQETPERVTGHKRVPAQESREQSVERRERKMVWGQFALLSIFLFPALFSGFQSSEVSCPEDYVVMKEDDSYTLECNSGAEDIIWTIPSNECVDQSLHDKTLHLFDLSQLCAGTYTCQTKDSQLLTSKHLLIDVDESLNIFCFTDSHVSSTLQCSVHIPFSSDTCVRAKVSSVEDTEWIYMKWTEDDNEKLEFNVTMRGLCPFEEQTNPILVTVEATTESQYAVGYKSYFIRDIVMPRPPEIREESTRLVLWSYPAPWANVSSFFPLLFEVNVIYKDNHEVSELVHGSNRSLSNVRCLRVRCRDQLYDSMWSTWSRVIPQSDWCWIR